MNRIRPSSIPGMLTAGIVLALTLGACVEHNLPATIVSCDGLSEISYADEVKPIVLTNCAIDGCHNGDNGTDLNWTVFDNFHARAVGGQLQDRITRNILATGHMPKTGSITFDQIQTIYCWVEQGAKDN